MEWNEITVGCITAVVLAIIFGLFFGSNGTYVALIIAGLITGYISYGNYVEGLINGGIVGLLAGVVLAFLSFLLTIIFGSSAGFGSGILVGALDMGTILYFILIYGIIAALGSLVVTSLKEGIIKYRF